MTTLSSIPGIGQSSLELLEAAGFLNAEALAKAGVEELAKELERANRILQIADVTPDRSHVEAWIASARELGLAPTGEMKGSLPTNGVVADADAAATLLSDAPYAIPLPASVLMEQQLGVAEIPPAIFLNGDTAALESGTGSHVPAVKPIRPATPAGAVKISEPNVSRLDIDVSRVKPIDALAGAAPRSVASQSATMDDRVALIRAPRVKTNMGRDPQSRRYIRGVLHSHPFSIGVGAAVTLLMVIALPAAVISAALLLLLSEMPEQFGWVPEWLLAFPLALPVLGIVYLIWGLNGSCRVCGQKLFVPRMCLKNSKAHHIRGLGYIIPVCLHILLFKWFRCTYCGTPIRLKE